MELGSQKKQLSNQQRLLLKIQQATAKLHEIETAATEPIAIIGIGCRLPGGVDSPETYWKFLKDAKDVRTQIPKDRWDVDLYYDPDPNVPGKIYVRQGYFLQQPIDQFDPAFFGISGTEAAKMDASQRLLLEVTWEALENAGISPRSLKNTDTGVYIGQMNHDYAIIGANSLTEELPDFYLGIGTTPSMSAGRIAYILGLQGPTLFLDTSCSSSLVTLHLACQSLRSRESNLALVGGVNLMLAPNATHALCQGKALSPDSRCKTFDASADGFARGEGCGIVVLKRLRDALADSDRILALVKGSAINHDGPSSGLTVPNQQAQKKVIRQALKNAKVDPLEIDYVECHGTGTSLGDPLEVRALEEVYCQQRTKEQLLLLGAVKSNIGHLEGAAGIAGVIKIVLALQHQEIPANLHFHEPNPRIDWEQIPVKVPITALPWSKEEKPRLAGISGFGMSGTNAHVILEEAPREGNRQTPPLSPLEGKATVGANCHSPLHGNSPVQEDNLERSIHLLTLSAKTETALAELISNYHNYLQTHPELGVADICYTANTGRSHFNHRLAVVASNQQDLAEKLRDYQQTEEVTGVFSGELENNTTTAKIAFLFTGQGSQYVNMGRQLYQQAPVFREAINQCDQILTTLETFQETSLPEILYPADQDSSDSSLLDQTAYTQPALFAIEYALFQLWQSWGIKPDVVMGHSVGEYVAATVAGVFSLEEGLKLIAARGSLMQQLPAGGEMVSVMASKSKVESLLNQYQKQVTIAAINGPESVVISGESEAVVAVVSSLESQGIKTKQLQVSHAFHSPLMEPMLAEFEAVANQLTYHQPQIPVISNLTGTIADKNIITAQYWVNHVRQPVRFAQGIQALHKQGYETFLEIGAKPILLGMGRQCLPEGRGVWLPSLRPGIDQWQQMLASLGGLYVQGAEVDWLGFDQNYNRAKVVLPTYPFQRTRYWLETQKGHQQKPYLSTAKNRHPLLGEKLDLAAIENQHCFQSYVTTESPSYLKDHQVFEQIIFPATGYLEMATAAGNNLLKSSEQMVISDVVIARGLVLPKSKIKTLQTVVSALEKNSYKFEIFSTSEAENQQTSQWMLHAEGKISPDSTIKRKPKINLEKYKKECSQAIDIKEHYQQCESIGINYGSSFQGIKQLWQGQGKVLAEIALPEELIAQLSDYQFHPALLDAALQIIGYALDNTETDTTYLPVGIEKLKLYRQPTSQVWAIAEIAETNLTGNIILVDNQGGVIADLERLRLTATTPSALLSSLQPDISHWYYQINWQAQPLKAPTPLQTQINKWLVLAEDAQLVATLQDKGHECIRVSPGDRYQQLAPQHYQINPTVAEQCQQLLAENPGITGIVHLWGIREPQSKDNLEIQTIQEKSCAALLHLVQAIINSKPQAMPQLWLVTQGTQSVNSDTEVINPEYGSLWGLGRVIAQEHPELRCKRLDCDPNSEPTQIVNSLIAELLSEDIEDQIAIRQGNRYVARLVQTPQPNQITSATQPEQLKLSKYGVIDNLCWQPMQRDTPKANEVEIEVKTVGLNFRDVLNALGLLKDYYAQHVGITSAEQLTFGFECAGTISAIGAQVSNWQVGDEVMATILHDCFSSFITAPAEHVIAKPQSMSFVEAATLPLTFFTAYYGLEHLAKIQPGERVLIHAAAGGVGQAAVQIALQAGAEIFATASPSKWAFLKSLGIKYIMNSRTVAFADQIREHTSGEGVDVVLNSLNGEYIAKSLEVLAPRGRFIEIGKIGIWSQQQVQEKRPDVSYFPFDLGEVVQQQPEMMAQLSEALTQKWNQGKLKALPYKVFPSEEITAAFRYMQQAKQIGKVVVEMPKALGEPKSIQPQASYLITGGLGALGLEVAEWMVQQGARNLVLTGRRAPNETAQQVITELETAGANVSVLLGDISRQEDVAKIFQQMEASLPPLKGVIHAAGLLDDGVLQNMSWQQFTKVMAPKVQGTWHLHQLTQDLPLDFFVCFSSMASMLGSPGQGNYAAANAFMDAMAHYRRGMGLPGLSINWGAWASAGMAASLDTQHQQRFDAVGISAIEPERGMQALGSLLSDSPSQVGVFPVNWSKFVRQLPTQQKIPFLEALISVEPSLSQNSAFREQLESVPVSERQELLTTHIRSLIAKTLGLTDANKIGRRQPLFDLGLDSLMAVEVKNRLESSLQTSLRSTLLFDYPTLEALLEYLANDVIPIEFSSELDEAEKKVELDKEEITGEPVSQLSNEPIAIIGMSCRFPGGVDSPEAFWQLLNDGVDAITEVPLERWNIEHYYDPNPDAPGKVSSRDGGFLSDIARFDAPFFGISPREAQSLDPQQRLLLEVSWEAIERANIVPEQLFNSLSGVFIGIGSSDYLNRLSTSEMPQAYWGTGNAPSAATGRLSYILGLTGPNLAVETACSSSLVSVHLACQSLRQRECHLALAGGVNLILSPRLSVVFSQAKMLSPDGRCKTFDASANGYVRGEGCGVIVLKRLSDALADGDKILAVIRGTAVNQDGASGGLTVPNGPSQEAVICQALANGGVEPASVSYVEAHGTGTSLGDPIEVGALGTVFGQTHSVKRPLIIGTVKTNIGHLEVAAGIAGLMKVVVQLQQQQIAPSLHFKQPNPYINWSQLPLQVPTQLTHWQSNSQSRIAGVSSFGFSGTNAHIILEEAPREGNRQTPPVSPQGGKATVGANGHSPVQEDDLERSIHLLTLSAKTPTALSELVSNYHNYVQTHRELSIADICYTANTGRTHFNHRLAVVASNQQDLAEKLRQHQQGEEVTGVFLGKLPHNNTTPKVAFLFIDKDSKYINRGRQLYETQPIFRQALDQCDQILRCYLENSLLEVIYREQGMGNDEVSSLLDQSTYSQPALFAIEYALAQLWQSWGIKPDVLLGDRVGEYVAACLAGVFSLEDGLKLIATRGKLMQQCPNDPVSIASELESVAQEITYTQPQIPLISNVTGEPVERSFDTPPSLPKNTVGGLANEITSAEYWVNHLREPLSLAQTMETLEQEGYELLLEIGLCSRLVTKSLQLELEDTEACLSSLPPPQAEWQPILASLAQLYIKGANVDWSGFDKDYLRSKVVLPTYPFQRQRYWIETSELNQPKDILETHSSPIFDLINQGDTEGLTQELNLAENLTEAETKLLPKLLSTLIKKHRHYLEPSVKFSGILQQLEVAPDRERSELMINYLQNLVGNLLGLDKSQKPDSQLGFADLGLSYAMMLELGELIEARFGWSVSVTTLLEHFNIQELSNYLLVQFFGRESENQKQISGLTNREESISVSSEIEPLDEEAIATAIQEEEMATAIQDELKEITLLLNNEES